MDKGDGDKDRQERWQARAYRLQNPGEDLSQDNAEGPFESEGYDLYHVQADDVAVVTYRIIRRNHGRLTITELLDRLFIITLIRLIWWAFETQAKVAVQASGTRA